MEMILSNVKAVELNSLIQFMNDLTDEEYNRIFTTTLSSDAEHPFNGTVINLNFNELVNVYYNILPVKIPKRKSKRYRKNKSLIDPKIIDHFRDVVNEFIKYLANENLNVSILENTK